jgi:hypothetical protein
VRWGGATSESEGGQGERTEVGKVTRMGWADQHKVGCEKPGMLGERQGGGCEKRAREDARGEARRPGKGGRDQGEAGVVGENLEAGRAV